MYEFWGGGGVDGHIFEQTELHWTMDKTEQCLRNH